MDPMQLALRLGQQGALHQKIKEGLGMAMGIGEQAQQELAARNHQAQMLDRQQQIEDQRQADRMQLARERMQMQHQARQRSGDQDRQAQLELRRQKMLQDERFRRDKLAADQGLKQTQFHRQDTRDEQRHQQALEAEQRKNDEYTRRSQGRMGDWWDKQTERERSAFDLGDYRHDQRTQDVASKEQQQRDEFDRRRDRLTQDQQDAEQRRRDEFDRQHGIKLEDWWGQQTERERHSFDLSDYNREGASEEYDRRTRERGGEYDRRLKERRDTPEQQYRDSYFADKARMWKGLPDSEKHRVLGFDWKQQKLSPDELDQRYAGRMANSEIMQLQKLQGKEIDPSSDDYKQEFQKRFLNHMQMLGHQSTSDNPKGEYPPPVRRPLGKGGAGGTDERGGQGGDADLGRRSGRTVLDDINGTPDEEDTEDTAPPEVPLEGEGDWDYGALGGSGAPKDVLAQVNGQEADQRPAGRATFRDVASDVQGGPDDREGADPRLIADAVAAHEAAMRREKDDPFHTLQYGQAFAAPRNETARELWRLSPDALRMVDPQAFDDYFQRAQRQHAPAPLKASETPAPGLLSVEEDLPPEGRFKQMQQKYGQLSDEAAGGSYLGKFASGYWQPSPAQDQMRQIREAVQEDPELREEYGKSQASKALGATADVLGMIVGGGLVSPARRAASELTSELAPVAAEEVAARTAAQPAERGIIEELSQGAYPAEDILKAPKKLGDLPEEVVASTQELPPDRLQHPELYDLLDQRQKLMHRAPRGDDAEELQKIERQIYELQKEEGLSIDDPRVRVEQETEAIKQSLRDASPELSDEAMRARRASLQGNLAHGQEQAPGFNDLSEGDLVKDLTRYHAGIDSMDELAPDEYKQVKAILDEARETQHEVGPQVGQEDLLARNTDELISQAAARGEAPASAGRVRGIQLNAGVGPTQQMLDDAIAKNRAGYQDYLTKEYNLNDANQVRERLAIEQAIMRDPDLKANPDILEDLVSKFTNQAERNPRSVGIPDILKPGALGPASTAPPAFQLPEAVAVLRGPTAKAAMQVAEDTRTLNAGALGKIKAGSPESRGLFMLSAGFVDEAGTPTAIGQVAGLPAEGWRVTPEVVQALKDANDLHDEMFFRAEAAGAFEHGDHLPSWLDFAWEHKDDLQEYRYLNGKDLLWQVKVPAKPQDWAEMNYDGISALRGYVASMNRHTNMREPVEFLKNELIPAYAGAKQQAAKLWLAAALGQTLPVESSFARYVGRYFPDAVKNPVVALYNYLLGNLSLNLIGGNVGSAMFVGTMGAINTVSTNSLKHLGQGIGRFVEEGWQPTMRALQRAGVSAVPAEVLGEKAAGQVFAYYRDKVNYGLHDYVVNTVRGINYWAGMAEGAEEAAKRGMVGQAFDDFVKTVATSRALKVHGAGAALDDAWLFNDPALKGLMQFQRPVAAQQALVGEMLDRARNGNWEPIAKFAAATGAAVTAGLSIGIYGKHPLKRMVHWMPGAQMFTGQSGTFGEDSPIVNLVHGLADLAPGSRQDKFEQARDLAIEALNPLGGFVQARKLLRGGIINTPEKDKKGKRQFERSAAPEGASPSGKSILDLMNNPGA